LNQAFQEKSPPKAIDRLVAQFSREMRDVDAVIRERLGSKVDLIPELGGHLVHAGGKRLRPLFTLAGASMFGPINDAAIKLAATVEFIHTATLLHDDVVDMSSKRRGRQTANDVWGNKAPILVGDYLFARAFELMVEADSLPIMAILSGASARIAEGEVLQLTTAHDTGLDAQTYYRIIEAKTAVLFEAALHVGALAAGASPDAAKHLAKFGTSYGCAFQIIDDYLDYAGSEDVIGKRPGDDFREGKLTLPAILAMTDHQDGLLPLFEQDDREASFDDAKKLIISSGALDGTKQQAMNFAHDAQAILADHDAPVANMLYDLAEEALARAF